MKRTLRIMMVGGLMAAGLTISASPAHALCAGYTSGPGGSGGGAGEENLGVWNCDPCPGALYYYGGRIQVVACLESE